MTAIVLSDGPDWELALAMTEKQLQAHVVDAAQKLGWMAYHTYSSMRSVPGFPDLILIRGPRLLAVELKSARGMTTAAQRAWLGTFAGVPNVECYLWRPLDWLDGTIEQVLTREDGTA